MGAVHRLARAIFSDADYLFNHTQEALQPGHIVAFEKAGVIRVLGTILDALPEEDRDRAEATLKEPERDVGESLQAVQRGWQVGVELGGEGSGTAGPAANASVAGVVTFGIGGGCFLDVAADQCKVRTLGPNRLWLLRRAADVLQDHHFLIEEVIRTGYVAAATNGWSSKLGLSINGEVDPGSVGIGTLGELQVSGNLSVTVRSGRVFLRKYSDAFPLFRAVKAERLPDLLGDLEIDALPESMRRVPVRDLARRLPSLGRRTLDNATVDDVSAFYDMGDDE